MKTAQQIANRFREVLLNGRWVSNTNFQDQLSQVTYPEAVQKVGSLNTIAIITFHINYYVAGVMQVLEGGDLTIRDKFSFDMPPINSEEEWQAMRSKLFSNARRFAILLDAMSDQQLNMDFVEPKYGKYLRNMEGMIEHCYYHLGQIVMLRKLISEGVS